MNRGVLVVLRRWRSGKSNVLELDSRSVFEKSKPKPKKAKKIEWSMGSITMLAIPTITFTLGCWQVYRLRWKLQLIDNLKGQLEREATPLPEGLEKKVLNELEYCRVKVEGEYLYDREFLITPRGRFDPGVEKSAAAGSLLSENKMSTHGGHVITPFRLTTGKVILINRGWIPQEMFDREARRSSERKGRISFDAIVRKTESRPQFVQQNDPQRGVWFYRDVEEMARLYGTEPVWLDASYESTVKGGPIGGQTNVNVRNEHMQYLLTWYTLTAITIGMWLAKFRV